MEKCVEISENQFVVLGDGRNLSFFLNNDSIDCIVTDHPWDDNVSNTGGNRNFADYECFAYQKSDFEEAYRVLRKGCFLCEILPEENANNFDYLYKVKN